MKQFENSMKLAIAAMALLACSTAPARAAVVVSSQSVTTITSASSLDNSWDEVAAVNFANATGAPTAPTINDIVFTNQTTTTGITTNFFSPQLANSTAAYSTSGDAERVAAFDAIFDTRVQPSGNTGGVEVRLNLTGLDTTKTYRIQLLSGSADATRATRSYTSTSLTDTSPTINIGGGANTLAAIFTYEFTTTTDTATFLLKRSAGTDRPVLNGYVLQVMPTPVPTPAALPAGLGLIGLLAARRHPRR